MSIYNIQKKDIATQPFHTFLFDDKVFKICFIISLFLLTSTSSW